MSRLTRAAEELGLPKSIEVRNKIARLTITVMAMTSVLFNAGFAHAATLARSSTALSDPRPSQSGVSYTFTGGDTGGFVNTSTAIRCIKVVIATTATGTQAPTGFSGASATVNGASTLFNASPSGWTLAKSDGASSAGQNNIFQYTHATGVIPSNGTGRTFILDAITNSSVADTRYWYFLTTYNNVDCSTSPLDNATVEFINTNGSTLSLTVDNTLSFTVNAVASAQSCNGTTTTQASTATTIPFGTVSSASNGVVCQDLIAATNATNGYTIYARYTAAPTNPLSQTIAPHAGSNGTPTTFSAAGTESYGYTTDDGTLGTGTANRFTSGGQKWAAMTTSNAELAYEAAGVSTTTYRVGHQVGISTTTAPGTYTTTVIYTCTPVY